MEFHLTKINRDISLNDEVVSEFLKVGDLRESMFVLRLFHAFGDNYYSVPDNLLSNECNRVLIDEIKVCQNMPAILEASTKLNNQVPMEINVYQVG